MHGRVKVKTPAEQAEARKAERLKKSKWYTTTVEQIFTKRDSSELDGDLLRLTEELLRVNPDFATVWNARRKTLNHLIAKDRQASQAAASDCTDSPVPVSDTIISPPTGEAAPSDMGNSSNCQASSDAVTPTPSEQSPVSTGTAEAAACAEAATDDEPAAPATLTNDERLLPELALTVACLMVNPKSYGVWHHRTWVMDHLDNPRWGQEIDLCSKALSKDSRNFHCWDYRRFVSMRSTRPATDEVAFSTEKIKASYSNYSAWHNRSRLLPQIFPGSVGCGLNKEKMNEELEFAKNAMYTDPVDQSAFFYHRWLLGRGECQLGVRCLFVCRQSQQVVVVLNKPMNLLSGSACIEVDAEYEIAAWRTADPSSQVSTVLVCQLPTGLLSSSGSHMLTVEVTFRNESAAQLVHLDTDMPYACTHVVPASYNMFSSLAAPVDILQQELDSLVELLAINDEEGSKWALLTAVLLLQTLDPVAHRDQVRSYFAALQRIDSMRSGYYRDLSSRYYLQSVAQHVWQQQDPQQLWRCNQQLDVSNQSLYSLFHLDSYPWLHQLNISGNKLTSLNGCQVLIFLQELIADDNQITDIGYEVASLKCLSHLSLRNNGIVSVDERMKHFPRLQRLCLAGNPVAKDDCMAAIFSMVSSLEQLELE